MRAGAGFAALLAPQAPAAAASGRSEAAPNSLFRQRIAEAERSAEHPGGGWHLRNPRSGALGRYQFLPVALQDIGWRLPDGRWSALAAQHGVASEEDFLARPAAQEAAMTAFLQRLEAQLQRLGLTDRRGMVLRGLGGQEIPLTEAGLIAAAHRRGPAMLARWLRHRSETPDAPVPPPLRAAFLQLERRLLAFADVAYQPLRAPAAPGPALAGAGGQPSGA
ncbi:MAG: hypothetical protein RMK64_10815 [Rhodovarius sp.]|nr:hypothetical protein [Rhodovarius sp.]MDW8315450.1 hypothetical protein [Rhodovarius sp.]